MSEFHSRLDAHQPQDIARSGIITKTEIANETELLSALEQEAYTLILP